MATFKRFFAPLLLVAVLVASWLPGLNTLSMEQVDAGLKRALVTFATARTLNAAISVLQETDVTLQPLGVGVKIAPGQLLDPINDLVEKFSTLMLFASISFGIQRVLIELGGYWLVSAAVSAVIVLWSALHLLQRPIPIWVTKLLLVTLAIRFAIPIVTVGSNALFQHFLASDYAASQQSLGNGAVEVRKLTPDAALPESKGWLDQLKGGMPNFNVNERIQRLKNVGEEWTERMIRLSVIFLLETLLFPLLLLWALSALTRSVLAQERRQ